MLSANSSGLQAVSFCVWPIQRSPCGTALQDALEGIFLASGPSARVAFRFRAVQSLMLCTLTLRLQCVYNCLGNFFLQTPEVEALWSLWCYSTSGAIYKQFIANIHVNTEVKLEGSEMCPCKMIFRSLSSVQLICIKLPWQLRGCDLV